MTPLVGLRPEPDGHGRSPPWLVRKFRRVHGSPQWRAAGQRRERRASTNSKRARRCSKACAALKRAPPVAVAPEMLEQKKVAWVLGAGFSVPLGGPLFRDLISDRTLKALKSVEAYQRRIVVGEDSVFVHNYSAGVYVLFMRLLREHGQGARAGLWDDAEQFLDYLDIASRKPKGAIAKAIKDELKRLNSTDEPARWDNDASAGVALMRDNMKLLHSEAVRFVAGACVTFLSAAEEEPELVDNSEQWEPYRRWVQRLEGGKDSVLTFNYDRVLSILGEYRRRQSPKEDLLVSPVDVERAQFDAKAKYCVPMYHLHGHVGWRRNEDGTRVVRGQPSSEGFPIDPALAHEHPDDGVIGLPGQNKLLFPGGLLRDVWDRAIAAIEEATAVVFVGYRFPPTDNLAKRSILDALKKNPRAKVHVVLGANNPDMPRLRGMIEWTRDHKVNPVRVHEMFTEDLFAVFERDQLFE